MTELAKAKLATARPDQEVCFQQDDVLAYCRTAPSRAFDSILSTYTLHHLEEPEKLIFFREARRVLQPAGGRLVVGDLMFRNPDQRRQVLKHYREHDQQVLAEEIEDEFFWDLATAKEALEGLGFSVETRAFSQLSWGLLATTNSPWGYLGSTTDKSRNST